MAAAKCAACEAHKETVKALHMVIQAQNQTMKLLAEQRAVTTVSETVLNGPSPLEAQLHRLGLSDAPVEESLPRLWKDEDEEMLEALHQEGWLEDDEYERRLAALQAARPNVVSTR